LVFPSKNGNINVPEKIGAKCQTFGILLLQDEFGEKVDAIVKEKDDITNINLEILKKWLQGEGKKPISWGTLTQILRESSLAALAEMIEAVCPCD